MRYSKPVGLALAGALVLGAVLGGPVLMAGSAQPFDAASAETQDIPGKEDPEQHALGRLRALGMSDGEAQAVWNALGEDRRRELLLACHEPDWLEYLAFAFAWTQRLDRYEAYRAQNSELTAEETVVRVNIGLDTDPYGDPELVEDPESLTALVNQYHALPADYVPELVYLDSAYTNQRDSLRPVAYRAFQRMADAAAQEGLHLYNASAYRSYTTQKWVYQRYANQDGAQTADTYSARPGCSEHQTGLALDVNTASFSDHFEETEEYAWLVENSGRFGFILRFPEGKEDLTGYQFEPWHYRYVGVKAARQCWEQGWTLEEYAARQPAPERAGR